MNDNEFMYGIWKLVATVICVLITIIGGCSAYTDKLVITSPDPLASSCAASGSFNACMAAASRK